MIKSDNSNKKKCDGEREVEWERKEREIWRVTERVTERERDKEKEI